MKRFDLLSIFVVESDLSVEKDFLLGNSFILKGACAPPTDVFTPLPTTSDPEKTSVYAFKNQNSYSLLSRKKKKLKKEERKKAGFIRDLKIQAL